MKTPATRRGGVDTTRRAIVWLSGQAWTRGAGGARDRGGEDVSEENGARGDAGLVLGGGGARGAYASGALSVLLLPELKDQVRVIVGTSAGALIASYLVANWHRPAKEAIEDGLSFWRDLTFGDVWRR